MTPHEREYQRVTRKVRVKTPRGDQWANPGDTLNFDGQGNVEIIPKSAIESGQVDEDVLLFHIFGNRTGEMADPYTEIDIESEDVGWSTLEDAQRGWDGETEYVVTGEEGMKVEEPMQGEEGDEDSEDGDSGLL